MGCWGVACEYGPLPSEEGGQRMRCHLLVVLNARGASLSAGGCPTDRTESVRKSRVRTVLRIFYTTDTVRYRTCEGQGYDSHGLAGKRYGTRPRHRSRRGWETRESFIWRWSAGAEWPERLAALKHDLRRAVRCVVWWCCVRIRKRAGSAPCATIDRVRAPFVAVYRIVMSWRHYMRWPSSSLPPSTNPKRYRNREFPTPATHPA